MLLERGTMNGERGTGSGERDNEKIRTTQRIGNEVTNWARVQLPVRFCSHLSFSRLRPRSFPVPSLPPHLSNIPLSVVVTQYRDLTVQAMRPAYDSKDKLGYVMY